MRTSSHSRFGCFPSWAWLTIIILTECVLLAAWLCREYFVFDYTCFMVQIDSDLKSGHPQKIHLIVELPMESANQTRMLQERSTNATFENITLILPTNSTKLKKRKRPLRTRTLNSKRTTIESVVKIEPLLSLYSEKDEQVPFKTKTTWNKYHKQPPIRSQQNGTRRRRKKKRPADMARRQAALSKQQNRLLNVSTTTSPTIEYTMNSTDWDFDELTTRPPTMVMPIQALDTECSSCQDKGDAQQKVMDAQARWRTHGVGGPTSLVHSPTGLNFTEQLQNFASNAICIGRAMVNIWSVTELLAAIPFLLGIQFKIRCFFTFHLVLSALFLLVLFVYAATLTIFSLVLFMLVIDMKIEMLLDWMFFAAVLDAVFVFATLLFALTLQNCDALLTEYQQNQIVELPDTIIVDPDIIEHEDGRVKKQRSKSILYSQLAIDDFMNGRQV